MNLDPRTTILIFDQRLMSVIPGFQLWTAEYSHRFAVSSGESLKSLETFHSVLTKVHKKVGELANAKWTVLAIGGGSVGDFAGFFASVYKRGLRLVHIPTTWLAAIDSSHGGKTGLNFGGAKNQLGTFYPSEKTYLVRSILLGLAPAQARDAIGELVKIAVIDGGPWAKSLRLGQNARRSNKFVSYLWRVLPQAIEAKMKIVRRDPRETKGARMILNLGHTFGHVIESLTGKSHGESVWLGFLFALEFSIAEGYLKAREASVLSDWLRLQTLDSNQQIFLSKKKGLAGMTSKSVKRVLKQDKKRALGNGKSSQVPQVRFVFVKGFGRTVVRAVTVDKLVAFAKLNGWIN
jgi:3-dehydroquinate synthase